MGKIKVTQKSVREGYNYIIRVPYCGLQHLLEMESPNYYCSGQYGWNSDVYSVNDATAIAMGYRPFGNITPSYELRTKYENAAIQIRALYPFSIEYAECKNRLHSLIENFVKDAIAESKEK